MEKQALSGSNRCGPILFFNPYFKSMINRHRLLPPLPSRRPDLLSKMKNLSEGYNPARLQCRRHSRQETGACPIEEVEVAFGYGDLVFWLRRW
ncbi:unnamed protein product [Linum trigynum]|uniref:Uncharacterized protein n=1 Tax=Linum trigynum TaxID=586398 RepID=A0AAV2DPK0_9ROSI